MKNYYKILRVDREATADEIKKAYKTLVGEHHPAYNGGDRYATERFIDISVAYNTLINADKRKDYNRILDSVLPAYPKAEIKHVVKSPEPSRSTTHAYGLKDYRSVIVMVMLIVACVFAGVYGLRNISQNNIHAGLGTPGAKTINTSRDFKDRVVDTPIENKEAIKPKASPHSHKKREPEYAQIKGSDVTETDTEEFSETVAEINTLTTYEPLPGDTKNMILSSYGTPKSIVRFATGGETWYYANTTLNFRNDMLVSYQNK